MGVWIEIPFRLVLLLALLGVAPFVGVWIEIILFKATGTYYFVAPFVGVWIEIIFY